MIQAVFNKQSTENFIHGNSQIHFDTIAICFGCCCYCCYLTNACCHLYHHHDLKCSVALVSIHLHRHTISLDLNNQCGLIENVVSFTTVHSTVGGIIFSDLKFSSYGCFFISSFYFILLYFSIIRNNSEN